MRVVHLSLTPVAGSPWNLVTALNNHSEVAARLITLNPNAYGDRTFPNDLVWERDRDESRAVLSAADLIHLHQWFIPAEHFGREAGAICDKKPWVRQLHSVPSHFAGEDPERLAEVLGDKTPQLVIAQFHERYYPRARVVPNIVPLSSQLLSPCSAQRGQIPRIGWSPSVRESAWTTRWATKGYPETLKLLTRLADESCCMLDVIENVPHDECLRRKQTADLLLDELVTGSYHLSGLEGLAQGKPVVAWLDERSQNVLRELTGASSLPWVNVHLEDAENVLRVLLAEQDLRDAIGVESRAWMIRWYNDKDLIRHYVQAYRDVLERPDLFCRARDNDVAAHWRNVRLPDLLWEARRKRGQT